ncbi:OmpA family protein [Pelagibacterium lacus]|uniref:Cell envelope biogenesis protein OmpA n=1 Tax=Pelagibacterium lacus TaxID=2282655 RepID=A0A369W505_9HYPH|nr:OmpA family protein [Pelagibacterium lacus]RDE08945.1 cell envelope biogenesis protein OmpA [Pelagibacterium lacus]
MRTKAIALTAVAAMVLAGCSTNPFTGETQLSNTAGGALLGAGGGAVGGALIGSAMGDGRVGALIGAGIGALAGGAVGNYMDQQEAQLRAKLQGSGVSVTRVGDNIILNMPSNVTFGVDQSNVQPQFQGTLESVALVLKEYNQTLVDILGYTDSTGSASYNLTLSQQRATSVARTLSTFGVDSRRFFVEGRGMTNPIADNSTEAGRAQNRRVEIRIIPIRS